MGRYLLCSFLMLVLVVASAWAWCIQEPMSYFDKEYPMWRAKMDMAPNLPADSVVILGDSRAMADFVPLRIGPKVVNLAVGGGTSIEACVFARILLSSAHAPRAIIISFDPLHCMVSPSFWVRGGEFGFFSGTTLEQLRARSRDLNDRSLWLGRDPALSDCTPIFGPETVGDVEARLKIALYTAHFPSIYYAALLAGGLFERRDDNIKIYHEICQSLGYHSFGTSNGSREIDEEASLPTFTPSPLLDSYLSEIIALFESRNIPVYFIATPINEVSVPAFRPGFATDYAAYIQTFETRYSNFHRIGDPLPTLPWNYYGDASHLNGGGAQYYSSQVAPLLRAAGVIK